MRSGLPYIPFARAQAALNAGQAPGDRREVEG